MNRSRFSIEVEYNGGFCKCPFSYESNCQYCCALADYLGWDDHDGPCPLVKADIAVELKEDDPE